jgi:flagellin-like hook-associated protein FlgL
MANGIVLTNAIRQNLLSLQQTGELQGKIQERLATGKKVNSALDGPTNFFTAAGLNRRASDLSTILDGMMNGIKTLEAADKGMKGITQTVETMRAYTRQARQDKSFKGLSYTVDALAIGTTAVKNLSISGGAVGVTPVNVALNVADVGGSVTTQKTTATYTSPAAATAGTNTFAYAASAVAFGGADTSTFAISVDGATPATTVTINQARVQAVGNNDSTIDNITEFQAVLQGALFAAGVTGVNVTNNGTNVTLTSATTGATSSVVISAATPNADGGGNTNTLYGLANGAGTAGTAADSLDITINGTAVSVPAGRTLAQAVADINAQLGASHAFEAFDDGANRLGVRAKVAAATPLTIAGTDVGLFAAVTGGTPPTTVGSVRTVDQLVATINNNPNLIGKVKASNDGGKLHIDNISTEALTVVGATSSAVSGLTGAANTQTIGGNEVRKSLIAQFNELRQQLDRLAEDANYNGVNLLKADKLKIAFNEVSTSILEIEAKDSNGVVRPINTGAASLNIVAASAAEFSDDVLLEARVEALGDALTKLQTQSSAFGSSLSIVQVRQEFTKGMINTLEVGADSLTLADSNEEGANLLALNTRQQLAQTTLSLAAQAQQAVLRLFG